MNRVQKVLPGVVLVSFVLASAVAALADPQNYGMRAVRITSKCSDGLPDIPPPNTTTDPACPSVPTLAASPSGRWSIDISWFDPNTGKYYLADRNNFGIDIIDVKTDKVVGFAGGFVGIQPGSNTSGPNGVLTTTNPRQLWAGDGDGTVRVYSLDSHGLSPSLVKVVSAGGLRRADEMAFDPDDHLVLAAWDDDKDLFLQFISVSSNPTPVGSPIKLLDALGCGIEQPVYDHDLRKFFVAVPCTTAHTNGEIAVINPKTKLLEKVFGVDGTNCFPHGLALGPRNNLLLGCSGDNPDGDHPMISLIMKATDGSIIKTITEAGGSDEVWYNPGDNHYYLAMSSWTTTGVTSGPANPSLGIINAGTSNTGPGGPAWVQNIATTRTSHSVAAVFTGNCDRRDDGEDHGKGDDGKGQCQNKIYVPLTTVTESGGEVPAEILEVGGIGVYGQIP